MSALLETRSFAGTTDIAPAGRPGFVGTARFDGVITVTSRSRSEVARCLPSCFDLAANLSSMPDRHPLIFLFGEQTDGGTMFGSFELPLGVRYHELALAVPFVKHRWGDRIHTWIARMYSSYFPATWTGNAYYGFAKQMARMGWQGGMFVVTAEDGGLLLHAAAESAAAWTTAPSSDIADLGAIREVFALPIVGHKTDGDTVCSYFDLDFSAARVRPTDACVFADQPIITGLPASDYPDGPSGSIEVSGMTWRLSWPVPCQP